MGISFKVENQSEWNWATDIKDFKKLGDFKFGKRLNNSEVFQPITPYVNY